MSYTIIIFVFFFKPKTAYEMRISDRSSDVCSSDLFIDASRLVKQICIMGTEVEVDFLAWLHSPHCPKLAIRYGGIEPCAVSHAAFDLYYRAKIRQGHHHCA